MSTRCNERVSRRASSVWSSDQVAYTVMAQPSGEQWPAVIYFVGIVVIKGNIRLKNLDSDP